MLRQRSLILMGAFLAATTLASSHAISPTRDDAASEKLGIKLSLQCWTFKHLTLMETVDKAAGLGVKYLEIYSGQKFKPGSDEKINLDMSESMLAEINKKLADAGGLKLVGFGVSDVPTEPAKARETFQRAKRLGLSVLITETPPTDVHEQLCKEFNIRYALHNHPKTWPPDKILAACKNRCNLFGSCCDTGHWMRDGYVPVDMIKRLDGRVMHLHFKDLNQFGSGHDVAWGTGRGDPAAMLAELKRQGFRGYCSIEYEDASPQELEENLPKCVRFFDETMTRLAK